jgi:plasmid stability protein
VFVPTLHIRGVPVDLYERLKAQAEKNGRSLNTEVVDVLSKATPHKRSFDEVMASIEERAKRLGFGPDWPQPEDVIREDRDSH